MKVIKAIVIGIVAVIISVHVFADEVQENNKQYVMGARTLNALGITKLDIDKLKPDVKVSRTEFCDAIVAMMSEDDHSYEPYADMTSDNVGMQFLRNHSILNGNNSGEFLPYNVITLDEALKISVSVLGFEMASDYAGGWVTGYRKVATDIGITNGVELRYEEGLSYESFIALLLNITDAEILEMTSVGAQIKYERVKGTTLLSTYRNIYKEKGIVTANSFTGLYNAEANAKKGYITINDNTYICNFETQKYLGYYVGYYYNDETSEILHAVPYKNKNTFLEIDSADVISYKEGVYVYIDEGGRNKTVSINYNGPIIYNGVFTEAHDKEKFFPHTGGVLFLDNDGDGKYDVLFINDITVMIVEHIDTEKQRITDKYDATLNIDIRDFDGVRIIDEHGVQKDLFAVKIGDVLELKKSSANNYIEIKIVRRSMEGTLESLSEEADTTYINAKGPDGTSGYTLSKRFEDIAKNGEIKNLKVGTTYMIFFTTQGEIAYMTDITIAEDRIGYVRKFFAGANALSGQPMLKVLDQTGEWERYSFADRVTINGVNVKGDSISDTFISVNTVCKYSINIAGEIISIDFPGGNRDSISKIYDMSGVMLKRLSTGYNFGKNSTTELSLGYVDENAYVFVVPATEAKNNEDDFYRNVVTLSDIPISGSNTYDVETYSSEADVAVADVVVLKTSDSYGWIRGGSKRKPVVINKITRGINEYGELKYFMTCLADGKETVVTIEDRRTDTSAALPFGAGDVITYALSANGELVIYDDAKSYKVMLKYNDGNSIVSEGNTNLSERSQFEFSYSASLASSYIIRYGRIYETKDSMVYINESEDLMDTGSLIVCNCSNSYIYIYNEQTGMFENGSISDVVGYKTAGGGSNVFVALNESFSYLVIFP